MGEVYRARDSRLGRDVAVKMLSSDAAASPERRSRFEKEARAASALNHPNIVSIYDIGEAREITYIAMELVDGATLRDSLPASPLPAKKILDIAVPDRRRPREGARRRNRPPRPQAGERDAVAATGS